MISCVRQTDLTDCGVACVKSILNHYDIKVDLVDLKFLNPLKIGFYSFKDLAKLFEVFGIQAAGYICNLKLLDELREPVIAHLRTKLFLTHFVVVETIRNDLVYFMDPSSGKLKILDKSEFSKIWTGRILVTNSKNKSVHFDKQKNQIIFSYLINKRTTITIAFFLIIFFFTIKSYTI